VLKAIGLLKFNLENDANGGCQHNTAHASLISYAHSADILRNMMNMAYDRSWQAQVATPVARLLRSRRVQHANHTMNNDNNNNNASANTSASGYCKTNNIRIMVLQNIGQANKRK